MNRDTSRLIITFLGTGTSQGIPIINCSCQVCTSRDPRNKRLRTSITIQSRKTTFIIDSTPDFRQQLLNNPINRLDAVIYTHAHADHIYGLDDLRRFNQLQRSRIPVYASEPTLLRLKSIFTYAFGDGELKLGIPNLAGMIIDGPFYLNELLVTPIKLFHGNQEILGFRVGNTAYCTDVSRIPDESYLLLKDLDVLILGALRETPHPTHFSVDEAITEAQKIGAKQTFFVHMSHKIDHQLRQNTLPTGINFAYDGLVLKAS